MLLENKGLMLLENKGLMLFKVKKILFGNNTLNEDILNTK